MFNLKNNIIDVCNNYYRPLLNLQNVCSIALGLKYINNVNTFEPCIHVLVEKKIPSEYISYNNLIPKQYMGLKTDVIEIGKPRFLSNDSIPEKFRPLEGGCSLGIAVRLSSSELRFARGTLGCIVTKTYKENLKKYFILSNNHVLASINSLPIGTSIIQPSSENGGTKRDVVAHLSSFIHIHLSYPGIMEMVNFVDCAIAELSKPKLASSIIHGIGKLSGYSKAILNEPVKKVGYVSGLTSGYITSTNATLEFKFGDAVHIFQNQILAKLRIDTGDSGSIILNDSNQAIGLAFAGTDDGFLYMNDIGLVLKELDVDLYVN